MAKEFYRITDQQINVRLASITSFKLETISGQAAIEKCCIVVDASVFWCEKTNYYNLETIFGLAGF